LPITPLQEWFSIQIHTTCSSRAGGAPPQPQGVAGAGAAVAGVVDVVALGRVVDGGRVPAGACDAWTVAWLQPDMIVTASASDTMGALQWDRRVMVSVLALRRCDSDAQLYESARGTRRRRARERASEKLRDGTATKVHEAIVVFDGTASRESFVTGRTFPASINSKS
jgi:hypothetical protein